MDEIRDLLVKIKKSKMVGYIPKPEEAATCGILHEQSFISCEHIMFAGRTGDFSDKTGSRYYIKPKGHRYLGSYGSAVPAILYRGASSPVGYDRSGKRCNHLAGVFLSESREIAEYYSTRFSEDTPVIEECEISLHNMMTMEGKGFTSPELALNSMRNRYVNMYDGVKVVGMHMGHIDEHGNRGLTEDHKKYNVPELADVYIVFNVWDVHSLSKDLETDKLLQQGSVVKDSSGLDDLLVPSL